MKVTTIPLIKTLKCMDTPYIIAEVGSNWLYFGDCIQSVRKARAAGADAVKFQLYTHNDLYGIDGKLPNQLDPEWIPHLANECSSEGIDFLCTPFSVASAKLLDPYVKMHKVASSDLTYWPLLKFLSGTGKPILLSTGGSWGERDVRRAVRICNGGSVVSAETTNSTVIMHCVSSYPAHKAALLRLVSLGEAYPDAVIGYSDHSLDVYDIPRLAVEMGARVVEKHVNLVGVSGTPDSPHSLSFDDFKGMCTYLKDEVVPSEYWADKEQLGMRLKYSRRLTAITPIVRGDRLELDINVGFYRTKQEDRLGSHCFSVSPEDVAIADRNYSVGDGVYWSKLSL